MVDWTQLTLLVWKFAFFMIQRKCYYLDIKNECMFAEIILLRAEKHANRSADRCVEEVELTVLNTFTFLTTMIYYLPFDQMMHGRFKCFLMNWPLLGILFDPNTTCPGP